MKKLLSILGLFCVLSAGAYWYVSIVEVQRGTASVQVDDARLRVWYNLVAPTYADTTAANANLGLDYIGALIHTKTPAGIYFRDTTTAGHKWSILASTPASPIWGLITGTLSSQTDLQTALNNKQNLISLGTTAQYFRGDLSLATFPTDLSSFTNGPGYLTGVNVSMSIAGDGSSGTPLKFVNDLASPGANQYYGTDNGGAKHWLANSPILNIYNHDGTLLGDRTLSGSNTHSLLLDSLNGFTTNSAYLQFNAINTGVNATQFNQDNNAFQLSSSNAAATIFTLGLFVQDSITLRATNGTVDQFSITATTARLKGLPQANDTTPYKPVAVGTDGILKRMDGWAGSGGGGSSTATIQTITSGSSGTVTGSNYWVRFNPASALASYTLTLPASPTVGQSVTVIFGGTITAGIVVTAFTVSPNTSQSIIDNTPPAGSSVTADNAFEYLYIATNLWVRKKL